jgi:ATP-dependent Lhr-like helicase
LLRFQGGKKVPPILQRLKSEDLLAAVFPQAAACQDNIDGDREIPEHPLVKEVMKDVLTEALDLDGLTQVLDDMLDGKIRCVAIDTPVPSPFCHEILNVAPYAYLDDAPLEERRARAVELRRVLPENLQEVGALDPAAIDTVVREAWPDLRDADELHDLLQTLIAMPEEFSKRSASANWNEFMQLLMEKKRAARVQAAGKVFWVSAEKKKTFEAVEPQVQYINECAELDLPTLKKEDALNTMLQGWLTHLGPATVIELADIFGLEVPDVDFALLALEGTGAILRGQFRPGARESGILEWCDRRLLARIHKATVAKLRKGIEPVTAAQYMNWLLHWQHVATGTQLPADERGTLEILRQLQGYEIAANAWESQILSRRLKGYNPEILDRLCLMGQIGWGRLSPHPATLQEAGEDGRKWRVTPTSVAPIAFFVREDSDWLAPKHPSALFDNNQGLSNEAIAVKEYLKQRGASFFADIVRGTNKLKTEVENGLWELVAAGIVTADGFDNLRALIDPRRRAGQGRARMQRPRNSTGRWSILHADAVEQNKQIESMCWVLLRRYGVVFRDVLERESILPRWRELLIAFRRLEDRGEIRGGRFVSGFVGEQFALPEAVESLRASRNRPMQTEALTLSAADPLNLIGIVVPGKKTPATSSNTITIKDGAEHSPDLRKSELLA